MFWDSFLAGLKVLTYWETYAAALVYILVFLIPVLIAAMIVKNAGEERKKQSSLSMLIVPILEVTALAVFMLTLAPIIFGFGEDASWDMIWTAARSTPDTFLQFEGILIVIAIVLAFIPFFTLLKPFQTFVLGGVAMTFVLELLRASNPEWVVGPVEFLPDIWFAIGLFLIGGFISVAGLVLETILTHSFELGREGIGQLILTPVMTVFGFIPVFIYGAWIGAQVRGGF